MIRTYNKLQYERSGYVQSVAVGCWHHVTEASVLPVTQGVPAGAVYRATPLEAPRLVPASVSHNVRHHTTLSQQQD